MTGLTSSSIGRKFLMALSAMFLLIFLILHFSVNLLSVFSKDTFNEASHFMGYNPLIQYLMQPILVLGILFHFIMGFVLEAKNRSARPIKYAYNNGSANSSWASRNMIISGLVILAFLVLHMYDFWFHEMTYKYVNHLPEDPTRYWEELHEKFGNIVRVAFYIIAFVLLGLHLTHGFQSSFQSIGANSPKYMPAIKAISKAYAIIIPAGFIFVALYHYLTQH